MTAVSFMSTPGITTQTLATFLQSTKSIDDALLAVGMIRAPGVTGQIDFSTITVLPASNTVQGYAVYQFNDTHHAIMPVYLKIVYRTNNSVRPIVDISIGGSVSSTGVLGNLMSTVFSTPSTTGQSVPINSHIAGGPGYLTVSLWEDAGSNYSGLKFAIERSRVNNAPTAQGVVVFFPIIRSRVYDPTMLERRQDGALRYPDFATSESMALGVVPVFPSSPMFPLAGIPWQPISALAIPPAERPTDSFKVTLGGVERTYFAGVMTSGSELATTSGAQSGTASSSALLWE